MLMNPPNVGSCVMMGLVLKVLEFQSVIDMLVQITNNNCS